MTANEATIPALLEAIPEFAKSGDVNEWAVEEELATIVYADFAKFVTVLLEDSKKNHRLLKKCFGFIETLAGDESWDVRNLVGVGFMESLGQNHADQIAHAVLPYLGQQTIETIKPIAMFSSHLSTIVREFEKQS